MKIAAAVASLFMFTGICMGNYQIVATLDAPDTNISGLAFGNGGLVESVSSSVLPAAHGMTFDGDDYLWVSNMNTGEIYKIDLNCTSLERSTWGSIKSCF